MLLGTPDLTPLGCEKSDPLGVINETAMVVNPLLKEQPGLSNYHFQTLRFSQDKWQRGMRLFWGDLWLFQNCLKPSQISASEGKEGAEVPKVPLILPKKWMLLLLVIFVSGFIAQTQQMDLLPGKNGHWKWEYFVGQLGYECNAGRSDPSCVCCKMRRGTKQGFLWQPDSGVQVSPSRLMFLYWSRKLFRKSQKCNFLNKWMILVA